MKTWTAQALNRRLKLSGCFGGLMVMMYGVLLAGCAQNNTDLALAAEESQVKLRSIQQRWFDTADTALVLRGTLATLQDLGFVIDKADAALGTVAATKVSGDAWTGNKALKVTVTVHTIGQNRTLVRANAQWGLDTVEEPKPYQDFFRSLGKGLFLEANTVE